VLAKHGIMPAGCFTSSATCMLLRQLSMSGMFASRLGHVFVLSKSGFVVLPSWLWKCSSMFDV
jgi:hypothetical protein